MIPKRAFNSELFRYSNSCFSVTTRLIPFIKVSFGSIKLAGEDSIGKPFVLILASKTRQSGIFKKYCYLSGYSLAQRNPKCANNINSSRDSNFSPVTTGLVSVTAVSIESFFTCREVQLGNFLFRFFCDGILIVLKVQKHFVTYSDIEAHISP